MKLTTKGRYAVTAMLDLAIHAEHDPVSLAAISERQAISLSYLEQLFSKLRKSNLVASVRGPGGGYRLTAADDAIVVADVVDAVNESLDTTRCNRAGDCQNGEMCLTHYLWADLGDEIHRFLSGISLAQLRDKPEIQAVAQRQDQRQRDTALIAGDTRPASA